MPELMKTIQAAINFEGNLSAVDHFVAGSGEFIGAVDLYKNTFLIFCRHGAQGTPFFARVAMGEVTPNGSGARIRYRFTMRPWDRFFLGVGLCMTFAFASLGIFSVLVKPNGETAFLCVITLVMFALMWLSPKICQWIYRKDEPKIAALLAKLSS